MTLSVAEWGDRGATVLIGQHQRMGKALDRLLRFANSRSPVLLTGETGTGKELFARALFLSSRRYRRVFLSVNCAQYGNPQLVASELFGHRKGSFTGAASDHRGIFEEAVGGTVFLDEVGELPASAQAMLLRVLSEGEIVPVGANRPRNVDIRFIAASSRPFTKLIEAGSFRADLYYRLRQLRVEVPPLRERGNDWQLIARYYVSRMNREFEETKRLAEDCLSSLRTYQWPGNVRELRSCVETGYHLSQGGDIGFADVCEALETDTRLAQFDRIPLVHPRSLCDRMVHDGETFWDVIHAPFMSRDLNRSEVRSVIREGLALASGSYKKLIGLFGVTEAEYLKFMDYLRHHNLKPERP